MTSCLRVHTLLFQSGYHRLTNFEFRVYSPGIETPVTCATYSGIVGAGAMETLTCADDVYGQYVQFIRLGGGSQINLVTLCEVKIEGALYPGMYNLHNIHVHVYVFIMFFYLIHVYRCKYDTYVIV